MPASEKGKKIHRLKKHAATFEWLELLNWTVYKMLEMWLFVFLFWNGFAIVKYDTVCFGYVYLCVEFVLLKQQEAEFILLCARQDTCLPLMQ